MEKEKSLTSKQKQFCQEYLIDLNATKAAARAGYSQKTAYSQGQRLLSNVYIFPNTISRRLPENYLIKPVKT